MDWDKLRIFRTVAREGSLTRAGELMHLHQSAISRQIKSLETSLSTTLFHRHARGLLLTEQGELLLEATDAMARRLENATARIRDTRDEVFGELRVTTTVGFGTLWLAPRLATLYRRFPEFRIDLMLEERVLDLAMRQADVAIRMKEPSQADLVRRRLLDVRMRLFATETYLAAHPAPKGIGELKDHRLICQSFDDEPNGASASFVEDLVKQGITTQLKVNNYFGVLQGVIHDLGIGVLPDYLPDHFPELVQVLPELNSRAIPVYLAYPVELRSSRKLQTFKDFILEETGRSE